MQLGYTDYSSWKYHPDLISERLNRVLDTIKLVQDRGIHFDCLIVHGTSGTWLAPLLIMKGYPVVMVRKEGENSHGESIEGPDAGIDYTRGVFVDDLIASGETIRRVKKLLADEDTKNKLQMVAIILHDRLFYPDQKEQGIPIFGYRGVS